MNIGIIGAGMTGITAGFRLAQCGHNVTIYDKESFIGGLASAIPLGNTELDRFYHHIFVSDSDILNLIDELGIKDSLNWYEPKNAIYIDNFLHPFTSPMDLLLFKPISFFSRIGMGLLVLSSKFIKDYTPFESITAREWIIKRSGREAYEKIWEPLLKSKFDIDSDNVSGTWIWNKFKLRGSSRGKNIGKEKLGYMDGGFIALLKQMADYINGNGGSIKLSSEVKSINCTEDGQVELITSNSKACYDKVLFTGSPDLLADTCPELSRGYENTLRNIKYKANLCLILELSESLSPYYWITVSQKGFPFVLVIEHTDLVGDKGYGSHIVYLSRYCDISDPIFSLPDNEIVNEFIAGLKIIFPKFSDNNIIKTTLSKAQYAQPVVTLDYGSNIPDIKTPVKGVFLASMPQIYPEDRGLNYAVRLGNKAANEILNDL